jgi:hypothetical protein
MTDIEIEEEVKCIVKNSKMVSAVIAIVLVVAFLSMVLTLVKPIYKDNQCGNGTVNMPCSSDDKFNIAAIILFGVISIGALSYGLWRPIAYFVGLLRIIDNTNKPEVTLRASSHN